MKTKILLLLMLLGVVSTCAFSQLTIAAQIAAGGSDGDLLQCMSVTTDGGFIAGGYSFSNASGNKSENTRGINGLPDFWIMKYTRTGKIQWEKTIGGFKDDYLSVILQTADGGYIAGGQSLSDSSAQKTQDNKGRNNTGDYWIVKLNAAGNILWDKTIGGRETDLLTCLRQTADGGYILGGTSFSNRSGDKTQDSKGGADYWIIKLNATGDIIWDKTIGGNEDDYAKAIQQTTDGGFIIAGYSVSAASGDKTENSRGGTDFWLVKLNTAGNIEWNKTIGGNSSEYVNTIVQTADGGFVAAGSSASGISGDKTENNRGGMDYWVIKTGAGGNLLWNKTYGGGNDDYLYDLTLLSNGGFATCGESMSNISGEKTENNRDLQAFTSDYWTVFLDNNGNKVADKTIGTKTNDLAFGIKQISNSSYVVAGYSDGKVNNDKTVASKGSYDYWMVQLNNLSNVGNTQTVQESILQTTNNKVTICPNPAKDFITVTGLLQKTSIQITNVNGAVVINKVINNEAQVNVSQLTPGIYSLTYKDGNEYKTLRFVKE